MYELAKKSREAMKSKARRLAAERTEKVDSSDWSPAPLLNADMKTGARPIMKPSAKGIGESNAARDTKAALGSAHRGAFKDGGGVKDKKALGAIDPTPKRGAAQHYKDGGEKWIAGAIKKPGALRKSLGVKKGETIPAKKLEKAAEKGGKLGQRARLAQTLKGMRKGKDLGGVAEVLSPAYALIRALQRGGKDEERDTANRLQGAAMANAARKKGGKVAKKKGGSVGLTVVIADKGGARQPQQPMMPPRTAPVAPPMPQMQGPPPGAVPPAPMPNVDPRNIQTPAARQMPIGLKTGGRITKVAKSYKDMEAGAATGEGRLQKTDIAKLHKGAPARKDGGRISKVAKSYKDMTAGAGDGEGRLQKTDIAKAKKGRAA